MILKKWILATTVSLLAASAPLFAAQAGSPPPEAAVKATSQPPVEAENTGVIQSPAADSTQTGSPLASYSRNSSLYAGLGMSLLNDRGFTGLMPKAMVGYGIYFGCDRKFYSALELGGGAGSILLSTNNQHYRVSHFVNLSILPGYMIYDEVMLYARLGAQATHYSKLNSTKNGGVYGLGVEFNFSQHWDARVEYNYANNKNLNQYILDFIYKFR